MSTRSLIWLCAAACTGKAEETDDLTGTDSGETTPDTDTPTDGPSDTGTGTDTGTAPALVPEWGLAPVFVQIASGVDGLYVPRDLEFHPDHPDQLFVVNRATDSVTVIFEPGAAGQRTEEYADAFGYHFMEEVAALAFGEDTVVPDGGTNSSFATCQESRNTYNGYSPPNDFMGPALWPGDLDVLAQVHQDDGLLGSHLDMLHQTSYCMGIAHDSDNAYWVFDGQDGELMFYDFQEPHGHGEDDHSDGIVRHYPEVALTRVPDVPGHMQLDQTTGLLYIADTGAGRVLVVDTLTGGLADDLPLFSNGEPLEEHSEMGSVQVRVLVEGLGQPSGLALHDGRLFVSDHQTGEILAFDLDGNELGRVTAPDGPGIMGLTVGPEGTLWYVDAEHELVVHIEPG
jgi:DNA-binding beta-propeller fold protein YncE